MFNIALYQPDIPQNTAAIVRLCASFGARLDIIEPCGFFLSDKRFKRVVMDYINKCKIKSFKDFTEFKKDKKKGDYAFTDQSQYCCDEFAQEPDKKY